MPPVPKVSVHGGHSGTFCNHAVDTLEEVVDRYIELGFQWICLTEHMPSRSKKHIPIEESEAGFDVAMLHRRFENYILEAHRLRDLHRDHMDILVGFETDAYSGYQKEVASLITQFKPDLIVGSVHHVHDVLFDGTLQDYQRAIDLSGGIENLYCDYFDIQLELINAFEPAIVGHFDLIRIYDEHYMKRWTVPRIRERAVRNLMRIKELDLILDLNVRAFAKGNAEPYVSAPWLEIAIQNNITIVPGDDAHGITSVGMHLDEGISQLIAKGGSTSWIKPELGRHRS